MPLETASSFIAPHFIIKCPGLDNTLYDDCAKNVSKSQVVV